MKWCCLCLSLLLVTTFSCKKAVNDVGKLSGSWRMISVIDNKTKQQITKPDSLNGDVIMNFTLVNPNSLKMIGHTLVNDIKCDQVNIDGNRNFHFTTFYTTKVGDFPWSDFLYDNVYKIHKYEMTDGGYLLLRSDVQTLIWER